MERFRNITIIFLLAVGLLNSIAPPICFANRSSGTKPARLAGVKTRQASVLLQEGLYAEQVDGDLDAAIKIYEQVIAEAKETQRAAAQATYRIGMCYLKKGEKQKAAEQFRNLISKFPEHESLVINAGKQLAKLKPIGGFGPVFERIIYSEETGKPFFFDLDTAKAFSPPPGLTRSSPKREVIEWSATKGIDFVNSRGHLELVEMTTVKVESDMWESATPAEIKDALLKGSTRNFLPTRSKDYTISSPITYVFKTRERGIGILQVLEKKDNNLRIRYKMLQEQAKTVAVGWRKVFLPDADSRGLDVVLDLASGELLPAGEGKQQLIGTFAELGKGDLAYDRVIICLRGAVAKLRKKDELTKLTKVEQIEDLTAYQLPSAPCSLLVTTTEGDKYDVTVLSVTGSGLYLEYKILSEQAVREGVSPAWDTAEAFLAAAVSGRDSEAIRLVKPGSAVVRQVKGFRQILDPEKLKIVSVYTDERIAVVTTTEISVEDQKGLMLIRLIKQRGIWMVEDIDIETPVSLKAELDSFLKKHPNAKKLQEVHFRNRWPP